MIRLATLAAFAALAAAPAFAEDSIHISTVGKSPEQVRAEVTAAARKLCSREMFGSLFQSGDLQSCLTHTVRATLAQSHDPAIRLASTAAN